MSLSGVSGSAVGYANFIAIFVISVIDMFYLRDSTCHALLVSTSFILMMTLMMNFFDKHIYDIMFMHFLLASYLWNKLNVNLPNFLTKHMLDKPRKHTLFCGCGSLSTNILIKELYVFSMACLYITLQMVVAVVATFSI